MLDLIITSKTRIKLLLKLFLNSSTQSHLREMEREFGESTNAIRQELNRFARAKLISYKMDKGKKVYRANAQHPLFNDINNILRKMVGIDKIIDKVTSQIGNLEAAYITGSFAEGVDSDTIDLVLVGTRLDDNYIKELVKKAESRVDRKIIYMLLSKEQFVHFFKSQTVLLIWQKKNTQPVVSPADKKSSDQS